MNSNSLLTHNFHTFQVLLNGVSWISSSKKNKRIVLRYKEFKKKKIGDFFLFQRNLIVNRNENKQLLRDSRLQSI